MKLHKSAQAIFFMGRRCVEAKSKCLADIYMFSFEGG